MSKEDLPAAKFKFPYLCRPFSQFKKREAMQEIPIFEGVKELIFDLDGTLADTRPAHFTAWRDT